MYYAWCNIRKGVVSSINRTLREVVSYDNLHLFYVRNLATYRVHFVSPASPFATHTVTVFLVNVPWVFYEAA